MLRSNWCWTFILSVVLLLTYPTVSVSLAPFVVYRVNTVFHTLCLSFVNYFELYKTGEILTVLSDTLYVPLRKVELLTESLGRKEASCCSVSIFSSSLSLSIYIYIYIIYIIYIYIL